MSLNRRQFLNLAAGGAATSILVNGSTRADPSPALRAIAFDAFTIFDARPITTVAEQLFPGHGAELTNLWRTRQFEYTWLRTLYGHYADFWRVTQDSLVFAAFGRGIYLRQYTPDLRLIKPKSIMPLRKLAESG
jgi:2-haloacid dehalogenase